MIDALIVGGRVDLVVVSPVIPTLQQRVDCTRCIDPEKLVTRNLIRRAAPVRLSSSANGSSSVGSASVADVTSTPWAGAITALVSGSVGSTQ